MKRMPPCDQAATVLIVIGVAMLKPCDIITSLFLLSFLSISVFILSNLRFIPQPFPLADAPAEAAVLCHSHQGFGEVATFGAAPATALHCQLHITGAGINCDPRRAAAIN